MEIFDHIGRIVAGRDAVIIECGCYDGYHTKLMQDLCSRVAKSRRMVVVEPNSRVLKHAISRASDPMTTFLHAAICEHDGDITLYVSSGPKPNEYLGSSSVNPPDKVTEVYPGMKFDETMIVQAITLDSIFAMLGRPQIDFIWANIQGAEKRMIRGGLAKALPHTRYLYTEFSGGGLYCDDATLEDIVALLPGWRIVENWGSDVLLENEALL